MSTEIEVNNCIIFTIKRINIHLKMQNTIMLLILVAKTCGKVLKCLRLRVDFVFINKVKVAKFSFLNEKSYNKTVIDFNFGRHEDLSTPNQLPFRSRFEFFTDLSMPSVTIKYQFFTSVIIWKHFLTCQRIWHQFFPPVRFDTNFSHLMI